MSTATRFIVPTALCIALGSGCGASAKVTRSTPVADLQTYRVAGIRAQGIPQATGLVEQLGMSTVSSVMEKCQFDSVVLDGQAGAQPDLWIDLNLQKSFRGGTGIIQNENKATVEVLMVLSDGIDDELLGSAYITGESSSVAISGTSPEGSAVDAVAKVIGDLLGKSGCTGTRVARAPDPVEPPPGDDDDDTPPPSDDDDDDVPPPDDDDDDMPPGDDDDDDDTPNPEAAAKAAAEALNDEGKSLFKNGNVNGAVAKFEQAADTFPDPRYNYNLCVGYENLERYDEAAAQCQMVIDAKPEKRLIDKATNRLGIIKELRK